MHRDRGVAQHRLRTRRRDDQGSRLVGERVRELPEPALLLLAVDLEIRHRGAELRVPVDEPLAAVDEPVLEQAHERLDDRARETLVHRESLARPVAGRAQTPHLARDRAAGLLLPGPDALDERVAAHVVARRALGLQLLLDDDLRRDARVVGADLPERVVAAHPVPADHHVHQRLLERVAHVQRARDVRRRELDAERRRAGLHRRFEPAARFPQRVPLRLDGVGLEALCEFHGGSGQTRRAPGRSKRAEL